MFILESLNAIKIPLVWLRDHCRNVQHYNWQTNQRLSDCSNLIENSNLSA